MLKSVVRLAAGAASAAAFAALSGCSQPPAEAPPPPPQAYQAPPPAQGLAGGPPPPAPARSQGLAGGPRKPVVVVHMAPIPNPEDLPPAERARIYGPGRHGGPNHGGPPPRRWRDASGREHVAMNPVPNPEDMSARDRARVYGHGGSGHHASGHAAVGGHHSTAPAHMAAAKPAPAAPVSKPAPMPAAKPAPAAPPPAATVAAAPPPVVAAPPAATTPAAPPMDPKLAKLQAAVGMAATNGAVLTVADSVGKGQPGKVTLTLAQDFAATFKREAGKAGLAAAAKKTDLSALLSGDGYTVTPNGAQVVHLGSGEALKFEWLVTPGAGEKSPLKAQVDAILSGAGKAQSFTLATIEQAVKAAEPMEPTVKKSPFSLDMLSIPGMKDVDLGFAKVPSKSLVAGLIVLLILLILVMVVRGNGAARAREERRKKFRTLTDYGLNSVEAEPAAQPAYEPPPTPSYATFSEPAAYSPPAPEPHHETQTNYVNPMIAAAAGAAAGAAVTHAVDEHHHAEAAAVEHHGDHHDDHHAGDHHGEHHDDHQAHDGHADGHHDDGHHDDHGHGDHGHGDHGHDAHHHEPEHA